MIESEKDMSQSCPALAGTKYLKHAHRTDAQLELYTR